MNAPVVKGPLVLRSTTTTLDILVASLGEHRVAREGCVLGVAPTDEEAVLEALWICGCIVLLPVSGMPFPAVPAQKMSSST